MRVWFPYLLYSEIGLSKPSLHLLLGERRRGASGVELGAWAVALSRPVLEPSTPGWAQWTSSCLCFLTYKIKVIISTAKCAVKKLDYTWGGWPSNFYCEASVSIIIIIVIIIKCLKYQRRKINNIHSNIVIKVWLLYLY